jgi:hypothetical protein
MLSASPGGRVTDEAILVDRTVAGFTPPVGPFVESPQRVIDVIEDPLGVRQEFLVFACALSIEFHPLTLPTSGGL